MWSNTLYFIFICSDRLQIYAKLMTNHDWSEYANTFSLLSFFKRKKMKTSLCSLLEQGA